MGKTSLRVTSADSIDRGERGEILLTPANVSKLITERYKNKALCVSLASKLKSHASGTMPQKLISERRPNESEEIQKYRASIYVPITKRTISKVFSSLEKIRRSQDWQVQFDANKVPKTIVEDETPEKYIESNYPHFSSLTNWTFSVLLRKYLLDANGIVAVIPEHLPENGSDYVKPIAEFFDSDQIMSYVEGEYVVLKSRDTTSYMTADGVQETNGAIYHLLTKTQYVRFEQIAHDEFSEDDIYIHNIGELPAFKVGGVYHSRVNNDTIYESRIAGMIPSLDEAAREYSDLQAELLQHIHSEKYMYTNVECPECKGLGRIPEMDADGNITGEKTCPHCKGSGKIANVSPYGVFMINAGRAMEQQLPNPPIGYVQKSTEIAKFADEHVRQHIMDALAAINMEFLADTPLSQSGVAKAYDRDELNNFVNGVAEDVVAIDDKIAKFIIEYRYKMVVPNDNARRDLLPKINVPTKFDILNVSTLMAELKAARDAQANPIILRELEIDYAKKQFNTDPEIAHIIETTFMLDPLFGKSDEEKMTMLSNDGVSKRDYIISCNINAFIQRAVREDANFMQLDYEKQRDVLKGYADEIEKENEPIQTSPIIPTGKPDDEPDPNDPNPDDPSKKSPVDGDE